MFLFLHTGEYLTRVNPRCEALAMGQVFQIFKTQSLSLGVFPWFLYAVMGAGFAYFTHTLKRSASLAPAILPEHRQHPKLFFYHYINVISFSHTLFPVLFISTLCLLWLSEGICHAFQWPSLFETPFRTLFIVALLLVYFQKNNQRLLDWLKLKRIPLGGMITLYIIILSFFLIWIHGFATWFFEGYEHLDRSLAMKSEIAGHLSENEQNTRISLLIWGYFGIWIPWMVSFTGRMCIILGSRPWLGALFTFIYPGLVFYGISEYGQVTHWNAVWNILDQNPHLQIMLSFALMIFIMMIWGRTQTTADLERGAMVSIGHLHPRPLTKWMSLFILIFTCYFSALLLIGFIPSQVIGTLSAGFMMTVVVGFAISLYGTLFFKRGNHKSRDPISASIDS